MAKGEGRGCALPKGKAGPGRPKGCKNKVSMDAREAIAVVYERLGSHEAFFKWVKASPENKDWFYKNHIVHCIPKESKVDLTSGGLTLEQIIAGSREAEPGKQ